MCAVAAALHDRAMTSFLLSPQDPSLAQSLTLRLHESLVAGLRSTGALHGDRLSTSDAAALTAWANTCDNPSGQRAALARMVAGVALFGNGAVLTLEPVTAARTGFWGAV